MHAAAVVWIDTDGEFKISSQETLDEAAFVARYTNESGYPAVIIQRQEVIDGDLKSNAQLEEEEDAESGS